jgi:hypothetical protein
LSDQPITGLPTPPPEPTPITVNVGGGEATYRTVTDGVKPFTAHIGDRSFRFVRKPNAALQLRLAKMAGQEMGLEHVSFVTDVLSAMLEVPADVDTILELVDAEEVARLINDVTKKMSARPTTARPASSPGPSETISDTGSPEQV